VNKQFTRLALKGGCVDEHMADQMVRHQYIYIYNLLLIIAKRCNNMNNNSNMLKIINKNCFILKLLQRLFSALWPPERLASRPG
jgi:hypothetical protein